jgi:flavin-dependent dehydrogenase
MVESAYPRGLHGVALGRSVLDAALVQEAMRTGASFEPGVAVREAIVEERRNGRLVTGVSIGAGGQERPLAARVVIGADGRRSTLAFKLGLASHASKPRRWAIGAYFEEAGAQARRGEMHIRRGRYIGVAPLPGGLANVCLVKPSGPGDPDLHEPEAALRREIAAEPLLRDRYAGARLVRPPIVLGPLAVDSSERAIDGLILAGDAAGFIDPITGDGLRFAVRGAEMAAASALHALAHGWSGVHARLAAGRRREFGAKWRFNRALRLMVSDARTIQLLAATARLAPGATRAMIEYAGDCGIARHAPAAPRAGVAEFT